MEIKEAILKRYSVRKYKSLPIENDKIYEILEAGRNAPSAVNFQPWRFIVIKEPKNLLEVQKTYHRDWFKTAPVVIVICCDHSVSWKRPSDGKDFGFVDAAIAIDHMTLLATSLGLGTCWICNFDSLLCKKLYQLPDHIEPVALLPVGYPDGEMPSRKRKNFEEVVYWEKFSKQD